MPQGVQCWDASGILTFDSSWDSGRILGFVTIAGQSGSITLPVSGIGRPFILVPSIPTYNSQFTPGTYTKQSAQITLDGNTMSWNFPFSFFVSNITVYYGAY